MASGLQEVGLTCILTNHRCLQVTVVNIVSDFVVSAWSRDSPEDFDVFVVWSLGNDSALDSI